MSVVDGNLALEILKSVAQSFKIRQDLTGRWRNTTVMYILAAGVNQVALQCKNTAALPTE